MAIQFKDNKILFVDNKIAMDSDCCCDSAVFPGCLDWDVSCPSIDVTIEATDIHPSRCSSPTNPIFADTVGSQTWTVTHDGSPGNQWRWHKRFIGAYLREVFDSWSSWDLEIWLDCAGFQMWEAPTGNPMNYGGGARKIGDVSELQTSGCPSGELVWNCDNSSVSYWTNVNAGSATITIS